MKEVTKKLTAFAALVAATLTLASVSAAAPPKGPDAIRLVLLPCPRATVSRPRSSALMLRTCCTARPVTTSSSGSMATT